MPKLTGFNKVAVIKVGCGVYHFAVYDDGTDYKSGDKVVVTGAAMTAIQTVDEIISVEEARERFSKDITAEVICKVDTTAFDLRVSQRREAMEIKKKMDRIIKHMNEEIKYETYAAKNADLRELLDRYNYLTIQTK